jgi:hypothetical protein
MSKWAFMLDGLLPKALQASLSRLEAAPTGLAMLSAGELSASISRIE